MLCGKMQSFHAKGRSTWLSLNFERLTSTSVSFFVILSLSATQ